MTETGQEWTIRRLLEWTTPFFVRKQVDAPRLSAELLLSHVLKIPRIRLYTDYERPLSPGDLATYRSLVKRAAEHEPIAYITGVAHFFNLELEVTRDVLIPRPDTETLVEHVLQTVRNQSGMESPRVLDLCTGSGCVAAAIAKNLKSATVLATDASPAAITIARRNMERLGLSGRVAVEQGDLYDAVARTVDAQPFHILTANPPYIPSAQIGQLDRNVREYEPLAALDGGPDGLVIFRRILQGAAPRLASGGRLFVEIAFDQGAPAAEFAAGQAELEQVRVIKDLAGHERVVTARRR